MKEKKELINIEVQSDVNNLDRLIGPTESLLEDIDFSTKSIFQLLIAVEEIFTNICKYAYTNNFGKVWYKIYQITYNKDFYIEIVLEDEGNEFNPLTSKSPNINLEAHSRTEGNLGLHMIKNFGLNIEYKFENNKNILTLRKER